MKTLFLAVCLAVRLQAQIPIDPISVLKALLSDAATETTQILNKIALGAQVANSAAQLSTARTQLQREADR